MAVHYVKVLARNRNLSMIEVVCLHIYDFHAQRYNSMLFLAISKHDLF